MQNYSRLIARAPDILRTAKGNYNLYLKRLRVSEFLPKFAETVSKSVSDLTASLISDLYKTVGVIVGAVIAIVLDPRYTLPIVALVAFLYLLYIGFILVYLLPSAGWRCRDRVREYDKHVAQLAGLLTKDEITILEGDSFRRAKAMFTTIYVATYLIYRLLALIAFAILAAGLLLVLKG